MQKWRLVIDEPLSGAMNMAVDEAIMLAVSRGTTEPTVRFYQWSVPTITLGYFQSFDKEVDSDRCSKLGVDVVRRLTGGRAVLHHHELTYSVVVPENNRVVKGTVLQTYLTISRGLVSGLRKLGIPAEISDGKKVYESSAACFDSPSRYEITAMGKKLIGSAQTRRGNCILQHGSVVIEDTADLLISCLKFKDEQSRQKAARSFVSNATSLASVLGSPPGFRNIAEFLTKSFSSEMGVSLIPQQLSDAEITEARDLCRAKYDIDEWNLRR